MNFFPTALADEAAAGAAQTPQPQFDFTFLIIMVGFIVVFYFLMMRPQNQKRKEMEQILSQLKPGDEIYTTGGIVGKIVKISENRDYYTVQVSASGTLMIRRVNVAGVLPKGTFDVVKSADLK